MLLRQARLLLLPRLRPRHSHPLLAWTCAGAASATSCAAWCSAPCTGQTRGGHWGPLLHLQAGG